MPRSAAAASPELSRVDVGQDDGHSLGRRPRGDRVADAAGGAGDDRDPALVTGHGSVLLLSAPQAAARPGDPAPGAREFRLAASSRVAGPVTMKYLSRQVSSHHAVSGPPTSSCELSGRPGLANVARFALVMGVIGIDRMLTFGPLLSSTRRVTLKYV